MAVLIFVLFWVLVAIGLTFMALSGGPGGARARLHGQSRGARRLTLAAFAAVLIVFGIVAPALVVAGVEGRDSIPEASVDSLTAQEERGREIYSTSGQCYLCHTLKAANTSATVGPNLDTLRPTANLVLDAIENGRARGNGAMAADLVQGEDAEAVAAFVAKAVGQTDN